MQLAALVERTPARVRDILDKYIDYKMAIAGAIFMGTVVWFINREHGAFGASTAALKQATYTFFFGGFVTRACENLATNIKRVWIAIPASVLLPSTFAICATLVVHHLRGTPEPIASTVPTMLFAPPSFLVLGLIHRRMARRHETSS